MLSILYIFNNSFDFLFLISAHLDPFVFHGFAETNFSNLTSNSFFYFSLESLFSKNKAVKVLLFGGTLGSVASSFFTQFDGFSFNLRQTDELFSF